MDAGDGNGNGICFPCDVFLDVLRRLPVHALAKSRRVCRAWRAIVDAHKLIPDLFPLAFPGIFVSKHNCWSDSCFLAPPAPRSQRRNTRRNGEEPGDHFRRPTFQHGGATIEHHCNGLLLLTDREGYSYVCNPATVRRAPLPMPSLSYSTTIFLAFDPAVSLHYEAFLLFRKKYPETSYSVEEQEFLTRWFGLDVELAYLPRLFGDEQYLSEEDQQDEQEQECSCSPRLSGDEQSSDEDEQEDDDNKEPEKKLLSTMVFSSRTGEWEKREFTPGRCAPPHLHDAVSTPPALGDEKWLSSEYWHGSLYVHCQHSVLMILRLSEGTYDMVQLPGEPCQAKVIYSLPVESVFVSYGRGIRYVVLRELDLTVWTLTESSDGGQLTWTLAHEANLEPHARHAHMIRMGGIKPKVAWKTNQNSRGLVSYLFGQGDGDEEHGQGYETTSHVDVDDDDDGSGGQEEEGWDSDSDNFMNVDEADQGLELDSWQRCCVIMGFHPHKDAVLLEFNSVVVAYHLGTSRMQYLCHERELTRDPRDPGYLYHRSFPYRPCYMDVLPAGEFSWPPG